MAAAKSGDLATLKRIVDKRPRLLGRRTEFKSTLLHNAGSAAVVQYLVEAGIPVDIRGWMNGSPLFDAVSGRSPKREVVAALLDAGADPNLIRDQGYVPLHFVGSVEVAELLLGGGAVLAIANRGGVLVGRMVLDDKPELLAFFLQRGVEIPDRSAPILGGSGPLHHAVKAKHLALVEVLLAHEAPLEAVNHAGETALMVAARVGDPTIIDRLLRAGADLGARDVQGQRPVDTAMAHGHRDLIAVLGGRDDDPGPEPIEDVDDADFVWCVPDFDVPRVWGWTRQGWLLRLDLDGPVARVTSSSALARTPRAAVLVGGSTPVLELIGPDALVRLDAQTLERLAQTPAQDREWEPPIVGSRDGRWAAWGRGDGGVGILDRQRGTMRRVEGGERHHDLEIDPTGRWLAVPASYQGGARLMVHDLSAPASDEAPEATVIVSRSDHRTSARRFIDTLVSVAFSPDGNRIACFETSAVHRDRRPKGWFGNVFVLDLGRGEVVGERAVIGRGENLGMGWFTNLAFTRDRIWYCSDDGSVRGLDPRDLREAVVLEPDTSDLAHRVFAWGDDVWVVGAGGTICRAAPR